MYITRSKDNGKLLMIRKYNNVLYLGINNILQKSAREWKVVEFSMNFNCILFCTTTGYFLPFFSSLKKKMEEKKENEISKLVLNHFFQDRFEIHWIFDSFKPKIRGPVSACNKLVLVVNC